MEGALMADIEIREIDGPDGQTLTVAIRRDKRLKKSARWQREHDGSILLRVPQRLPKRHLKPLLEDIADQLKKQRRTARRRTDADLQQRAKQINRKYFKGEISWEAIRWVGNMEKRLGSCTNGGPTDGHIRISDRIREWPDWVIDYVVAHELAHRVHADHSKAFWEFLQAAYPETARARGFIDGIAFVQGQDLEY